MLIHFECCKDHPNCPRCRLMHIAFGSDLLAVRFYLAVGAIFVGLGFLWPSTIFPNPESMTAGARATYLYMAKLLPEWAWGGLFFTQGATMLWSLLAGHRSRWLLWLDAVFGCVLWSTAILSCYAAYWPGWSHLFDYKMPAIMGGELATVIASWWVLVRYSFDDERDGNAG